MVHYYVNSDTGNDSNDGSEGSPVATITQAFTLIDAVEVSDKFMQVGIGLLEVLNLKIGLFLLITELLNKEAMDFLIRQQ
jgi:hypothetical protein